MDKSPEIFVIDEDKPTLIFDSSYAEHSHTIYINSTTDSITQSFSPFDYIKQLEKRLTEMEEKIAKVFSCN